jgi:hypothetical protein
VHSLLIAIEPGARDTGVEPDPHTQFELGYAEALSRLSQASAVESYTSGEVTLHLECLDELSWNARVAELTGVSNAQLPAELLVTRRHAT